MAKEYDNPEIPDVHTALDQLTVDSLKQLLNLLPDESKPTRKADCVASIERCLSGEKLKALWECQFSALWSHFAFGIKEPLNFRRNGASGFPA